jgi:hypothetical protein
VAESESSAETDSAGESSAASVDGTPPEGEDRREAARDSSEAEQGPPPYEPPQLSCSTNSNTYDAQGALGTEAEQEVLQNTYGLVGFTRLQRSDNKWGGLSVLMNHEILYKGRTAHAGYNFRKEKGPLHTKSQFTTQVHVGDGKVLLVESHLVTPVADPKPAPERAVESFRVHKADMLATYDRRLADEQSWDPGNDKAPGQQRRPPRPKRTPTPAAVDPNTTTPKGRAGSRGKTKRSSRGGTKGKGKGKGKGKAEAKAEAKGTGRGRGKGKATPTRTLQDVFEEGSGLDGFSSGGGGFGDDGHFSADSFSGDAGAGGMKNGAGGASAQDLSTLVAAQREEVRRLCAQADAAKKMMEECERRTKEMAATGSTSGAPNVKENVTVPAVGDGTTRELNPNPNRNPNDHSLQRSPPGNTPGTDTPPQHLPHHHATRARTGRLPAAPNNSMRGGAGYRVLAFMETEETDRLREEMERNRRDHQAQVARLQQQARTTKRRRFQSQLLLEDDHSDYFYYRL